MRNTPKMTVFHWHGDTFDLPAYAAIRAESEACANQCFTYNNEKVVALQFHMEMSEENISKILSQCSDEIVPGKYIQTSKEINDKNI